MSSKTIHKWHIAHWPALAWLETIIKTAALIIGIAAGWQALTTPNFSLPAGWRLAAFVILTLLSLGLIAAIFDRWTDKEIVAMIFVIINNLGHWGMIIGMATLPWPKMSLLLFAGLLFLGDVVKLVFIRAHRFTVRDYSPEVLLRLTAVYILGYTILFIITLLE